MTVPENQWQATEYSQHAAFVSSMAADVVALLEPQQGEAILDLGCGDGEIGEYLQTQGCQLTCVDASASMIAAATNRGLVARQLNGHQLDYARQFDAVFSNAALHWMLEPEKVMSGVNKALKKNGRFVAEMGGAGNIAALLKAISGVFKENPGFGVFNNPWYFPDIATYSALLVKAGFTVESIALIPRPTPLKSGLIKWLEVFAGSITAQLNSKQKSLFFAEVEARLKADLYCEQGGWVADYVRLRFKAIKHEEPGLY